MNTPTEALDAAVDALAASPLSRHPLDIQELADAARAALEAAAPHMLEAMRVQLRSQKYELTRSDAGWDAK